MFFFPIYTLVNIIITVQNMYMYNCIVVEYKKYIKSILTLVKWIYLNLQWVLPFFVVLVDVQYEQEQVKHTTR